MTPERKVWYDSLSKEEKEIRKIIKTREYRMHSLKQEMTAVITESRRNSWPSSPVVEKVFASYRREIGIIKRFVKILRKQIAMRPITDGEILASYDCPVCNNTVDEGFPGFRLPDEYCRYCGQKLRW